MTLVRRKRKNALVQPNLALTEHVVGSTLDAVGMSVEAHVPEHHDGAEEQSSGVGLVLASNVGSRAVNLSRVEEVSTPGRTVQGKHDRKKLMTMLVPTRRWRYQHRCYPRG